MAANPFDTATPSSGNPFDEATPIQQPGQTRKPSVLDPYYAALQKGATGAGKGLWDIASGIAGLPFALAGAPQQIARDISDLVTSPSTAIPAQAKRAGSFAVGMLPLAETGRAMISGQPLTVEDVSRDIVRSFGAKPISALAGQAGRSALKFGTRMLPGAGVELQELAGQQLGKMAERLTPGQDSVRAAYTRAREVGSPLIAMEHTRRVASEILQTEGKLGTQADRELMSLANDMLNTSRRGWDWELASSRAQRLLSELKKQRRLYGEPSKEMQSLYSAIRDDLEAPHPMVRLHGEEAASAQEAVGTVKDRLGQAESQTTQKREAWQAAQKLARRQFASEDLTEQVNKSMGVAGEGWHTVGVNRVIKWIEQQERAAKLGHPDTKARRWVQSWSPLELADMKRTLKDISKQVAAIPPMMGAHVGSAERLLMGAGGELIGHMTGTSPGVGGAAGIAGSFIVSRALVSPQGRAAIRTIMNMAPVNSPKFTFLLSNYLRASGMLSQEEEQNP